MNIYQKMSQATAEITAVAKNLNVGFGRASYKAAGEADVLCAVKKVEEKHGIYSYPVAREIIESGIIESMKADGSTYKQNYLRLAITYRFVNIEEPSDYIEITSYGDGIDTGDKATGKAMTYGDKYALMKAYKIITGEDPDQYASTEMAEKATKKEMPKKAVEQPSNLIDARMQGTLYTACKKAGKNPSDLDSLKGIKGWSSITIDQFREAMKELGEE
jgi:hypothetical protein